MATTTKIFSFIFLTTLTILSCSCSATIYKVGDSNGWTTKEDTFYEWVKQKEFHVGDSLIFEYDHNFNDVTQVFGALEYEFCDNSSPKAVYKTGHDVVTFTEPGYHYFITSNHVQCTLGQKLDVLVVLDPSSPLPTPPQSPRKKNFPFYKVYKVGDAKGWMVNEEDSEFYNKWSEEKEFHVGDNLFFEYDKDVVEEEDHVLEISGDLEFRSCDPTSPIGVYKTGQDIVRLTEPGVHYFISSKTSQCESGLKLRVVVAPAPTPNVQKFSPMDRLKKWLHTLKPHQ
ncbi:unnamed protein product [Cochlearia groenlandica]